VILGFELTLARQALYCLSHNASPQIGFISIAYYIHLVVSAWEDFKAMILLRKKKCSDQLVMLAKGRNGSVPWWMNGSCFHPQLAPVGGACGWERTLEWP
jgi:hypothetical protein